MQAQRYQFSVPTANESVSENAISKPCTLQLPPFILSSRVILSSYRFKRDNFHSKNFISNLKQVYKVATIPSKRSADHGCDVRLVERDYPLPPDINAEGY